MGPIASLVAGPEVQQSFLSGATSRTGRGHRKTRETGIIQKSEDVPSYKGSWPVEKLVDYIGGGVIRPVNHNIKPNQKAKKPTKKKVISKRDPTESDSGCGDCIVADHKELNSIDGPLGGVKDEEEESSLDDSSTTPSTGEFYDCTPVNESVPCITSITSVGEATLTEDFVTVQRKRRSRHVGHKGTWLSSTGKYRADCESEASTDGSRSTYVSASSSIRSGSPVDNSLPTSPLNSDVFVLQPHDVELSGANISRPCRTNSNSSNNKDKLSHINNSASDALNENNNNKKCSVKLKEDVVVGSSVPSDVHEIIENVCGVSSMCFIANSSSDVPEASSLGNNSQLPSRPTSIPTVTKTCQEKEPVNASKAFHKTSRNSRRKANKFSSKPGLKSLSGDSAHKNGGNSASQINHEDGMIGVKFKFECEEGCICGLDNCPSSSPSHSYTKVEVSNQSRRGKESKNCTTSIHLRTSTHGVGKYATEKNVTVECREIFTKNQSQFELTAAQKYFDNSFQEVLNRLSNENANCSWYAVE